MSSHSAPSANTTGGRIRSVLDFEKLKRERIPISMVTAYDSTSAAIVAESSVDCILVGDNVAMTMHGFDSTLPAGIDLMELHTAAVARAAKGKFVIGDLPFLSYRKGIPFAMDCVERLMKAGASAVKLEGIWGHEDVVKQIVGSGVPVMGHIGLTPQSVHGMGGYKVQGREEETANDLIQQAELLQKSGCFSVVLECVPTPLAADITGRLNIPTIGIGAGDRCDGQVLVFQDLLGLNRAFKPKFVKRFLNGADLFQDALTQFDSDVKSKSFPSEKESYR